ncbi:MAG: FkbM family methyltransferase [Flavobacterium sp.]|nr:MAG: FkbM family methyltransferase [Flavobacterium sp.]
MQKLTNLFRLDAANRSVVLKYLLKRVAGRSATMAEKFVNEYYFHLIRFNGILKEETKKYYCAFYRDLNITIRLRKKPSSDIDVFRQIFLLDEYKAVADAYRKSFGNKQDVNIIDAGANIGLTSVYLSKLFNKAKFVCIEPDDSNFESLSFNLQANGVENAAKVKGGVWSKDTNLKLVNDFRDQKDWSFRVEETDEKTGLEAFSIASLTQRHDMPIIDILKIDVEGSEKQIFAQDSDHSFLANTKCIAIEIHDEFNCREQIYSVLTSFGFEFFESEDLTIGVNKNLM